MTDPHPPVTIPGPTSGVSTPVGAAPSAYGLQTPAPVRVELVDQVAAAVLAVPGVAGLHGGSFGEAATYLPGRRVRGIRLREEGTDIHLTLTYGSPVLATAEKVRTAVAGLAPTPVHVTVDDIVPAATTPADTVPAVVTAPTV